MRLPTAVSKRRMRFVARSCRSFRRLPAGSIEVGPRTKGARFLAAGELRGGTIVAPSRLEMRVGDIARIPAGVPHAFVPNATDPWEFLLVKVRRPNEPLKRPPSTSR